MVIELYGFVPFEAAAAIKTLIKKLGFDHSRYSVVCLPPILVYDQDGELTNESGGKVIRVPGFEKIRSDPQILAELSSLLGVPVTMTDAPVVAGINGKVY
jgi:hypothetical protein